MFSSAIVGLTITFDGIEFNGINAHATSTGQPVLFIPSGTTTKVYINSCNIHDFLNPSGNGTIKLDGTASSFDIQGSTFNNCGGRILNNAAVATQGTTYLKNNTFSNCTTLLNSRLNILYNANSSGTVTVDHCTFYNVANAAVSDGILRVPSGSGAVTVTNSIFSSAATNLTANPIGYCYLAGLTTVPTGTNTFLTAPSYTNAGARDFTLTNRADFVGSDGFTAGNYSIYPALIALTAPTVGTGSGQTSSGLTANWTKVSNAISYDVAVYQGASLISTTNASGQATQSLAITGLASNTTYTYTVTAKGDGIAYSPSPASSPSIGVLTLGLTVPTVGTASSVSASGFTANWTAVANAVGYDVKVYIGSQLVSTTNVSGQATVSLDITGLSAGTTYTYKIVAKGDGSSYVDSTPSAASISFTTTAVAVAGISTNFADGTWGSIIPSPTTNLPASGSFPTSSINGFTLTKGLMYGGTSTGLQGEYHVNQIRLDKGTLGGMVTLPTVNSISQLEIHVVGTSPKQFIVRQYNTGTSAWDITVGTYTVTGTEDIFYIPVSGTNVSLRIENEATSTSSLQIYQITTRTTNPISVLGTPYQPNAATAITGSGFNASWNTVPNASGYLIRTYSTIGTLRNTFSVSGGATTSYAVTGMDTVRVGTYKVVAVGDYITYTNSNISPASTPYAITRLATPVVGVGSAATASGFTANWSTVVDASSYDVLVYQGASLISTTNASGQATTSVAITGLSEYTSYTYTVIAKGDGTTNFDSYPSTASASISTLRNLPKVTTPNIGTASSVLATGFTANWTAVDNAVSYNVSVYQGITYIKTVNASGQATSSVAITGLTAGLAYTYKVVAVGDGSTYDDSVISDASAIVTTNKLTTPTIGTASAVTPTGFTANWTAVANASSYSVILYYGSNAIDTKSAYGQSTQSIDFTGLTSGFSYTYKVQAIGDGTTYASSAVSVASASVTTNKLSTPAIGSASAITATGFTANWTAVANAVSYDVKVYNSGATLISTTNVSGQATNSLAITGLSNFTIYNYKLTAIGDVNYANSDISNVSANFITLDPAAVNTITTNFADLSWGTPLVSVPATTTYGSSTSNGFTLTNSCLTESTVKGPKGESHTNRISFDKQSTGAMVTLPTVNSVSQIEIHATAGSAGNGFFLQEYVPSSNSWVAVGGNYVYELATKTAGIDSIYIIPITRNVQTKFRIGNFANGAFNLYQVITRTTNPTLLARPIATVADGITGTGFTAHWSAIDNATNGYKIYLYKSTTLQSGYPVSISGQSTNNTIIEGLTPNTTTYNYKIQAIGNSDVDYSDSFLSIASPFSTSNTFNITGTTASSSLTTLDASSAVTVANGGTLTIDATKEVNSITIEKGGKLTNNTGITLTAASLTINSDASGTGTYVDNGTSVITSAIVNQWLKAGRNSYFSSSVTAATGSVILGADGLSGNSLWKYNEVNANWLDATTQSTELTVMNGFVAKKTGSDGVITFTGTLNTGSLTPITLYRTDNSNASRGFNLVGNPFPSYVDWTLATTSNLESSIWFRTKTTPAPVTLATSYVFDTYNAAGGQHTSLGATTVSKLIPPMQGFWVRVSTIGSGTLTFDNNARAHADVSTNSFKAPAAEKSTQEVLKLEVSNGTNKDEAIVYFNANASDSYDAYDSPKMTNANTAIPEIYTTVGNEQLVINGLNSIAANKELALGFNTGASNTFSIKASEVSNFDADTKIILKDNLLNTEWDLTGGSAYSFSSAATNNNTRFTVIFRTSGIATGIGIGNYNYDDSTLRIFKNENNQITIQRNFSENATVTICNAIGQKLISTRMTGTSKVIDKQFSAGVYFVTVSNEGNKVSKKVIIN
jgi:hypothetical protein